MKLLNVTKRLVKGQMQPRRDAVRVYNIKLNHENLDGRIHIAILMIMMYSLI